jgi:hypothetical protein
MCPFGLDRYQRLRRIDIRRFKLLSYDPFEVIGPRGHGLPVFAANGIWEWDANPNRKVISTRRPPF